MKGEVLEKSFRGCGSLSVGLSNLFDTQEL